MLLGKVVTSPTKILQYELMRGVSLVFFSFRAGNLSSHEVLGAGVHGMDSFHLLLLGVNQSMMATTCQSIHCYLPCNPHGSKVVACFCSTRLAIKILQWLSGSVCISFPLCLSDASPQILLILFTQRLVQCLT